VEFGVEIGEYRGVVRVRRGVFQRLLAERPTPERCVETYHPQRTRFERIAERKLRRRQLTEECGDRNARLRWLSVRLTLAPRLTSILDAFSSKLCSRRRRRIDEILALAYAGHVEVNDSLARFYSRRVRGLRRADPYRIRFRQ
jgi:hypothetical protein